MRRKLFSLLVVILPVLLPAQKQTIIPIPVSIQYTAGSFLIDNNTAINFDKTNNDLRLAANLFTLQVKNISGITLPANTAKVKSIILKFASTPEIGNEGYLLKVTSSSLIIICNNKAGIVNGMQSVFQTLPAIRTNQLLKVPCMEVKDYPRFKWRGMHLDVSRHFFSPDFIKEYIDLMARYKLNIFHWHLVDDGGWRIEIKKYPKLTSVGAWRVDETNKAWGDRPQANAGGEPTYGGYYTQEQVKEIVAYAAQRNVTIVPEIEMPGHVASAIASYPNLSCKQLFQLPMTGGNYTNMATSYCAGNDTVFTFLQDVLSEVISLFPSQYIHLGGDELDKIPWKVCPKCQARIKKEGLKDEDELQSYFMKRMEKFLVSKGRKMIGWDEILEGGLAPEATVMSWRGEAGGIEAAKMHHDVVMTPGKPLYFDHYQADPETEPLVIGGFNSLKNVYDYEPVPKELSAEQAKYVLGAQANVWTEFITTPEYVEYMVLPRMLALAEVLWSPKQSRDWNDFNERLKLQFNAFEQLGLHHSKGNFKVEIKPAPASGKLQVALFNETPGTNIFYTLDGTDPTLQSKQYKTPIDIDSSLVLKTVVVVDGKIMGKPTSQSFAMHKAIGRYVAYTNAPSRYYMADGINTLTDGVRGGLSPGKYWHGFSGKDLIATIDLGSEQAIHSITLGCIQRYNDWIFLPQYVNFEISVDGVNFTPIQKIMNDVPVGEKAPVIKNFTADFATQNVRYFRVTAKVLDAIPKGHPGEGKEAWLFADEMVVE
ncbi:glycoside hydrolase family 20 protein [soil metagenome]